MAEQIPLHRVIVREPVTYIPTGPTTGINVGAPTPGSFDPAAVRIAPAPEIRPEDVVLGTIQPHYDPLLRPVERPQWVSYFTGAPGLNRAAPGRGTRPTAGCAPTTARSAASSGRTAG
ncbi:hypothetical protein ACWGLG_16185 [Streptomyces antimycoticus]